MQKNRAGRKLNTAAGKRRRCLPLASLALCLLLVLSCFTGCAAVETFLDDVQKEGESETVKIALFQPFTGAEAEAAAEEIRGVQLAHKLYPKVLGKKVELIEADNRSDLSVGAQVAKELAKKDPAVVLGSYGNALTLSGSDVFAAEKIPYINITGSNPLLTAGSIFTYRVNAVDTDQGTAAARYVKETLGISSAAVLTASGDDLGIAVGRQFVGTLEDLVDQDDHEVQTVSYMAGTADFSLQIAALRSCKVDAVFLTGSAADSAAFIKQARAAGLNWTFVGTKNLSTEAFLTAAESAAEGVYAIGDYDPLQPTTELGNVFLSAYRAEYGAEAVPTVKEALGFEAYVLALSAIEGCGSTEGDSIKASIMLMEQFEGVTGAGAMDSAGNLKKSIYIQKVTGGMLTTVTAVAPY